MVPDVWDSVGKYRWEKVGIFVFIIRMIVWSYA